MNYEQVNAFLERIGAPAQKDEGEWVMASCPLAPYVDEHSGSYDSNPSFGIHIEDDAMSFYNCFTCKNKGPVSELAKQLGRLQDDNELVTYGKQLERGAIVMSAEVAYKEWDDASPKKNTKADTEPKVRLDQTKAFREYPSVFTEYRAIRYLRRRGIGFPAAVPI